MIDCSRTYLLCLISEWVLCERDRYIMERRLCDGITYERLAEEVDMSVRQIKNIVKKNESKIKGKLS